MSYRILRITNFYKEFIVSFYKRNPNIFELDYNEQLKDMIENFCELHCFLSSHLRALGNISSDIISNAKPLQNTWVKENNLKSTDPYKIIIHQIKSFKPDVLWIEDFALLKNGWKRHIKKEVPSVRLVAGHICAPFNKFLWKFKELDILFTCVPSMANDLNNKGIKTYLIYHSFEETLLKRIHNKTEKLHDLVFTGSLVTGNNYHDERITYLEKMLKSGINIEIFGNLEKQFKIILKSVLSFFTGKSGNDRWKFINYTKLLRNATHPPVFGLEMLDLLAASKMCFNIHGGVANRCAGNIKLFEATGVGTCLITDWKENITELFEPDDEVVTYKNYNECIDKIKWLTNNPKKCNEIAMNGQKRTLKDHTFKSRVMAINDIIQKELVKL